MVIVLLGLLLLVIVGVAFIAILTSGRKQDQSNGEKLIRQEFETKSHQKTDHLARDLPDDPDEAMRWLEQQAKEQNSGERRL
jgi:hypothetical protein